MASEMKIEIPTQLIEDTIRSELVRQIGGENKERLVEAIVRHSLEAKRDSYSSTTYFQDSVNEMIKAEATKIFKEWIEQNRAEISKALFKHLNEDKQKRLKDFCEQLAGNIKTYGISVNLNLNEKR